MTSRFKLFSTIAASVIVVGSSIYIIAAGQLDDSMLMPHALLNLVAGILLTVNVMLK